nr:hypothetical protein [Hespellia stercorisuis]
MADFVSLGKRNDGVRMGSLAVEEQQLAGCGTDGLDGEADSSGKCDSTGHHKKSGPDIEAVDAVQGIQML